MRHNRACTHCRSASFDRPRTPSGIASASNRGDDLVVIKHGPWVDAGPSYTVTQLMTALRQALVALGPSFESTGVAWTDGESYDEWDLTEEVLFEDLVNSAVRDDLRLFASSRPFVRYGHGDVPFFEGSWVEVIALGQQDTSSS